MNKVYVDVEFAVCPNPESDNPIHSLPIYLCELQFNIIIQCKTRQVLSYLTIKIYLQLQFWLLRVWTVWDDHIMVETRNRTFI
jgi:hypothetical protein